MATLAGAALGGGAAAFVLESTDSLLFAVLAGSLAALVASFLTNLMGGGHGSTYSGSASFHVDPFKPVHVHHAHDTGWVPKVAKPYVPKPAPAPYVPPVAHSSASSNGDPGPQSAP